MIDTIDTTFHERPKTLNRVHVVDTNGVFPFSVIDNAMRVSEFFHVIVGCELIGMDGVFNRAGNVIPDDRHNRPRLNVCSDLGVYLPLISMRQPNNRRFTLCAPSCTASRVFPADVRLINLDVTVHFTGFLIHQGTNLFEHAPCCFVGHSEFPLQLFSGYPTTGARHQEHGVKPRAKRCRRFVEYRSGCGEHVRSAKLAGIGGTSCNPVEFSGFEAVRADRPLRITSLKNKLQACIIIGKLGVKFFDGVFGGFHSLYLSILVHPHMRGEYYNRL